MAIKFLNTVQVDTDVLYVDASSNRVGIGTTGTPSTNLEVSSSSNLNGIDISVTTNPTQSGALFFTTNTASEGFMFRNANGTFQINSGGVPNSTSGTNRISIIGSSGNVGIGTTSPNATLDVYGNLHLGTTGNFSITQSPFTTTQFYVTGGGNGGTITFGAPASNTQNVSAQGDLYSYQGSIGTKQFGSFNNKISYNGDNYLNSGNLGIGTTSPSDKLEVAAANSQLRLTDTDDSRFTQFSYSSGKLVVRNNSTTTTTNQFTLDLDGKMGIGTTSPNEKLEVNGSVRVTGAGLDVGYGNNSNNFVQIGNGRTTNGFAFIDLIGDTTYSDYGLRLVRNNGGSDTNSEIIHRGTGFLNINAVNSGGITLKTSNAERVRINSSGNVGIGTTNPTRKLHVLGPGNLTPSAAGGIFLQTSGGGGLDIYATSTAANPVFNFRTFGGEEISFSPNSTELMRLKGSNVGVGTTSPRTKLHVSGLTGDDDPALGSSTAPFFVSNTSTSYGLNIGVNNVGASWLQAQSNTSAIAYEMSLNPLGGNVGVGFINPSYKLDVNGTGRFTNTLYYSSLVQQSQADTKKDIANIDKNKATAIPFKQYKYKTGDTERVRYGVIVEDIEQHYPELVHTGEDGVKGVSYIDLLVKRVAELEKELEDISLTPGPKGDTGATGAAGTNGTNGKNGADGNSHLSNVTSITFNHKANRLQVNIGGTVYNFAPSK